jgi:hypothetical protein
MATPPALREQRCLPLSQIPFYKNRRFKELNPRRRVYVNFNSKMPQSKKLCFVITREGLGELPRPSALRTRLMHFPFEIIIWDTKVF